MAGNSVSSLILFIAAMTVAAGVAGTLVTSVSNVADAIDERSFDLAHTVDTETTIISDPGSEAVYDDAAGEVTLLVKNTGSTALSASDGNVEVLVNGSYVPADDRSIEVVDGGAWTEGRVARLTVNRSLAPGAHRAVVLVNDDREVLEFST